MKKKKLQRIQQNDNIFQQTLSEFKSKPEWNKNVNTGYEKQNSIKRWEYFKKQNKNFGNENLNKLKKKSQWNASPVEEIK